MFFSPPLPTWQSKVSGQIIKVSDPNNLLPDCSATAHNSLKPHQQGFSAKCQVTVRIESLCGHNMIKFTQISRSVNTVFLNHEIGECWGYTVYRKAVKEYGSACNTQFLKDKHYTQSHLPFFTHQSCLGLPCQYLYSCDLPLCDLLILFSMYSLLTGCPTPDKSHVIYSLSPFPSCPQIPLSREDMQIPGKGRDTMDWCCGERINRSC